MLCFCRLNDILIKKVKMEIENVIQSLNLSINYIELSDLELNVECKNDEQLDLKLKSLFQHFKDTDNKSQRLVFYDEIVQIVRGQLKIMETVGEILDALKLSVKLLFVENCVTASGVVLLNEIFQLLPVSWNQDPVKVHLITKTIYETSNHDFNNTIFILNKIISFNKLGFYVALTLFWSLFLHHFKKDTHHYYKMYDVNKFFKLLQSHDRDAEKLQDSNDSDLNSILQLLLLISIYQTYVLLNKEPASNHEIFQEFFKVSPHDYEKLKTYLSRMKSLMDLRYPVNSKQNAEALMLVEFLELDIIKSINEDGNQQTTIEANNVNESMVVDDVKAQGIDTVGNNKE